MKGPSSTHGKAVAKRRGCREEPRRSTQGLDSVEEATTQPPPSDDERIVTNPVCVVPTSNDKSHSWPLEEKYDKKLCSHELRLAPATMPPDAAKFVLLDADEEQEQTPSLRLAPVTVPPDPSTLTLPDGDEEQGRIPPLPNEEQGTMGSSRPNTTTADDATSARDEVFSAYLPVTAEERRRRALANAVSATNVHVVERSQHRQKRNKCIQAFVILSILISAAVGITLGITLSHKDPPTPTPATEETPAPTSVRFGEVVRLVESLSNTTSLQDPSAPQYQAVQWMADEDALFDDLATVDPERFRKRYVLALFYFATDGPTSWLERSFFLKPDAHECEWRDTKLPDTQSWSGYVGVISCSPDDWVEGIEINQNNLTGTLPQELSALSSLAQLTVFQNGIAWWDIIFVYIFKLSNLQVFDVLFNDFTGTIPVEVARATSLLILNLDANYLTGTLSSEIGSLPSLGELGVIEIF